MTHSRYHSDTRIIIIYPFRRIPAAVFLYLQLSFVASRNAARRQGSFSSHAHPRFADCGPTRAKCSSKDPACLADAFRYTTPSLCFQSGCVKATFSPHPSVFQRSGCVGPRFSPHFDIFWHSGCESASGAPRNRRHLS